MGDWFVRGSWILVDLCVFCSRRLMGVADNLLSTIDGGRQVFGWSYGTQASQA